MGVASDDESTDASAAAAIGKIADEALRRAKRALEAKTRECDALRRELDETKAKLDESRANALAATAFARSRGATGADMLSFVS